MKHYFAENLSDILRIKMISQKTIAQALEITPSTVNQWVKGKREPSYELLIKLCLFLDIEPSELLGYQRIKKEALK